MIACPESAAGHCLLMGAPASVSAMQLRDLRMAVAARQDSNKDGAEGSSTKQAGRQNAVPQTAVMGQTGLERMVLSLCSMLNRSTWSTLACARSERILVTLGPDIGCCGASYMAHPVVVDINSMSQHKQATTLTSACLTPAHWIPQTDTASCLIEHAL